MRWQVEVMSMDKTDAQSVVVEAESWQRALQAARTARGEKGPISGFSIELLDEGYRAVDPLARLRFDVKRAADDAPLTDLASVARPAQSPAHPVPGAHAADAPPSAAEPKKKPPPPPPVRAAAPVVAPTPVLAFAPTNGGGPDATIRTEAVRFDAPATPPPPPPPPSAPSPEFSLPVPATQVIFKREHDPTERLPLTYREYVFTVARGVDEAACERLLRTQLALVRASIAAGRPGKFINLAVFDTVFQGRPPVPPVATLSWKDWKGEPQVAFPRRAPGNVQQRPLAPPPAPPVAEHHAPPVPPPPMAPPVASAPPIAAVPAAPPPATMPAAFPPPAAVPAAPAYAAPVPPHVAPPPPAAPPAPAYAAPVPPHVAPPPPVANNPFAAPFVPAAVDPFARGSAPLPPGVPVPAFGAPTPPITAPVQPVPPAPAFAPSGAAPSPPTVGGFPLPFGAPPATPLAPPVAIPPPPPAYAPAPPVSAAANGAAGDAPHRVAHPTPAPSRPSLRPMTAGGRRASGDELIANLFEAMHELNFARDVIEGGDYVLSLALDMIPSHAGLVHLYDIDRREYVIACVAGTGVDGLLNRRHAEGEALLSGAMRKRRAIVVTDARTDESVVAAERFAVLGGARSVIVSPVMKGGRFLGVIELMNPIDGVGFTDEEGNAVDYIAEQFGEFVTTRGMQLDPDRITRSVPPPG